MNIEEKESIMIWYPEKQDLRTTIDVLFQQMKKNLEENPRNLIVAGDKVPYVVSDFYAFLQRLNDFLSSKQKMMVLASFSKSNEMLAKTLGVYPSFVWTPTVSEAIDYIYMEELSKGLDGDI